MSKNIAIDLGTSSVLIYVKGRGVILQEPSVIIVDRITNRVVKAGREAADMAGRTPESYSEVYPLCDGVISMYNHTFVMLSRFLRKSCGRFMFKPDITITVPCRLTDVEEHAVKDIATELGAKNVFLIDSPLAAAIGAGVDITLPCGSMVIDIGGGTTDIAVISLGGIVVSDSIKVGGNKMNGAIVKYVRRKHGVVIGSASAEEAKIKAGAVWRCDEAKAAEVKGKGVATSVPTVVNLTSYDMIEALEEQVTKIVEAVCTVIEQTPPELICDISKNGILLTGGGSRIYGLDRLIASVTGIPVRTAEKPVSCAVTGAGRASDFSIPLTASSAARARRKI